MVLDTSVCGPSTPLQEFGKHASVDRSLQKDRLLQRPAANGRLEPSRSSQSGRMQGGSSISAEFADFAGAEPVGLHGTDARTNLDFAHFKHDGAPSVSGATSSLFPTCPDALFPAPLPEQQQQQQQPPAPSNFASPSASWVNNFQQLHVSRPSAPHDLSSPHSEITARIQPQTAFQPSHTLSSSPNRPPYFLGSAGSASSSLMHGSNHAQQSSPSVAANDEAVFEQAFVQAGADLDQLEQNEEEIRDAVRIASGEEETAMEPEAEDVTEEIATPQTSASAAEELLGSLEGDAGIGQEFYGGAFFALMQQVRDGQVSVSHDKLKQIQNQIYPQSPTISAAESNTSYEDSLFSSTTTTASTAYSSQADSSPEVDVDDLAHLHDDFTLLGYESGFGGYEYPEAMSIGDENVLYDGLPLAGNAEVAAAA